MIIGLPLMRSLLLAKRQSRGSREDDARDACRVITYPSRLLLRTHCELVPRIEAVMVVGVDKRAHFRRARKRENLFGRWGNLHDSPTTTARYTPYEKGVDIPYCETKQSHHAPYRSTCRWHRNPYFRCCDLCRPVESHGYCYAAVAMLLLL